MSHKAAHINGYYRLLPAIAMLRPMNNENVSEYIDEEAKAISANVFRFMSASLLTFTWPPDSLHENLVLRTIHEPCIFSVAVDRVSIAACLQRFCTG